MDNITTTICVNGELKPGDLVISTPADDFACLIGTVLSINKLGTPEHDAETGNDTDAVHVDFTDVEYSERRIAEIEDMFSELFQGPRLFEECPIDDALMSPDMLIRITGIGDDTLRAILDSREAAEALCELVEIGPGAVHDAQPAEQGGYMTEILYSPLFCSIYDKDEADSHDGEDYENTPISQQAAVYHEDAIHEAILRERMPDEEPRGLMTYFQIHGETDDSVDKKVRSLFVDVEAYEGKLWGVATLELTEPLTTEELATLKDYLTGQYSDGFGEGFEQRGIKTDFGELYVSLWSSDDEFFIDTQREFMQRLGLEPTERETPAQAALHEPDSFDDKATAALREQLIDRLNTNLADYFDSLHGMDGKEIASFSSEISVTTDAHYYLTEMHNFHTSELDYLLKFQNPLEVVSDAFDAAGVYDRSDIMWKIFDRQDALGGDYPLVTDETPAATAPEREAAGTRDELFERIAKRHCHVETLETRKRDSLDFHDVSVWGFKDALEEAFAAGQAHQIAQTKGMDKTGADREKHQPGRNTGEKSSVLEQIREAAKAPKEPRRDNPARDKSGPEL